MSLYGWIRTNQLDVPPPDTVSVTEWINSVDQQPLDQLWAEWLETRNHGLPAGYSATTLMREAAAGYRRYIRVGLAIAGAGLLLCIGAWLTGRTRRRPPQARAPARS